MVIYKYICLKLIFIYNIKMIKFNFDKKIFLINFIFRKIFDIYKIF